ncbi:phosphoribosylamine--glycine ligase [Candidatus Thalassarchaeum betae]|uniref:phosphoribosylamine--glycine ligase n=1 Tax=Candidatus Thalassarchaeum betae TaxID=2599289 RepID=UPI0030C6C699|nr:phosphoribosylamine--glycine ligase [Candidatus Thalassoarchaea betae]
MTGMTVLVVGGGGREHALGIGLAASESVASLHTAPGNAGTAMVGTNHDVSSSDIDGLASLAEELGAGLVVVGPEAPLVDGLADSLRAKGIACFGPHSEGARLEGSKLHAKRVMQSLGVPTGGCIVVEAADEIDAALDLFEAPWVVKRDVLAAGKGVTVTLDRQQAADALARGLESDGFVLLEEHLFGEEASVLVVMDESGYVCLPASQDHKRVGEGDTGPNTGGMGAYAPAPVATPTVLQRVVDEIVEPMHHHLRNQVTPYRGCLYLGLMIDSEGAPRVIEFNVRFGDPETQVTVPLISSDFAELLLACAEGRVSEIEVDFHTHSAATVVLASEGYPASSATGRVISGSEVDLGEGEISGFVHYAGTMFDGSGNLVSSGGRVLAATGIAPDLRSAVGVAYEVMGCIELEGSHFRSDIAYRAL